MLANLFYEAGYRGHTATEQRHYHQNAMEGTSRKGRGGVRREKLYLMVQWMSVPEDHFPGCAGQEAPVREWRGVERVAGLAVGRHCKVLNVWHKEADSLEKAGRSVQTPLCLALFRVMDLAM